MQLQVDRARQYRYAYLTGCSNGEVGHVLQRPFRVSLTHGVACMVRLTCETVYLHAVHLYGSGADSSSIHIPYEQKDPETASLA